MKIFSAISELHDLERQVPDLRKKADDERAKKEAVSHLTKCNRFRMFVFLSGGEKTARNRDKSYSEQSVLISTHG